MLGGVGRCWEGVGRRWEGLPFFANQVGVAFVQKKSVFSEGCHGPMDLEKALAEVQKKKKKKGEKRNETKKKKLCQDDIGGLHRET